MVRKLLALNGLAACLAVLHHATHWVITAQVWWADQFMNVQVPYYEFMGTPGFYIIRVIDEFAFAAVPAFLFISGYFVGILAGGKNISIPWNTIFTRIKYLLIPYLIWTWIILALRLLEGTSYSLREVVSLFILGGIAPPYYYVVVLIQLLILSPILVRPIKKRPWLFLGITIFFEIMVVITQYLALAGYESIMMNWMKVFFLNWRLPAYAIWFLIGMLAYFNLSAFQRFYLKHRWVILSLMLCFLIVGIVESELIRRYLGREWISPQSTVFGQLFILSLLLSYLAFDVFGGKVNAILNRIGGQSYGIFLTHILVLELVARLTYHIAPLLLSRALLFFVILSAAGIILPIILMRMVAISPARRYYRYLFG